MNPEDNPNASLGELIQRAWQLEMQLQRQERQTVESIQAQTVRERIETIKRQLKEQP